MPLSALAGRAEIFQRALDRCFYGPTFREEAYSFIAARAAIDTYRAEPVAQFVWDHGTRLQAGIDARCRDVGVKAACQGPPFRFAVMFDDPDLGRFMLKQTLFQQELLKGGITTLNNIMLPCYAHDEDTLAQTLEVVGQALEKVREAEKCDGFDRYLEIPPLLFDL